MLKICCLCLNTDREDRTPDLLGVNQPLIPAELCQYMYIFIILSSLVHIQTIPAWNLWELNPSDFLLARQTTTPCSPKPHLPSLIRCLGFTFRLQTITFLFIYLVRKPFNYREHWPRVFKAFRTQVRGSYARHLYTRLVYTNPPARTTFRFGLVGS